MAKKDDPPNDPGVHYSMTGLEDLKPDNHHSLGPSLDDDTSSDELFAQRDRKGFIQRVINFIRRG